MESYPAQLPLQMLKQQEHLQREQSLIQMPIIQQLGNYLVLMQLERQLGLLQLAVAVARMLSEKYMEGELYFMFGMVVRMV